MSIEKGILYVVATPIGNRGDMTVRAVEVLKAVTLIAAEDTRHSRPLLNYYAITTPLMAFHEHNERQAMNKVTAMLQAGDSIALISDAGTPLISDPGFPLVRECHRLGIPVSPLPGASAALAALSAGGLPTDRFFFEGFPARTSHARREQFTRLKDEPATLVFYESSHRVADTLVDMAEVFGESRTAVMARELTKLHETLRQDSLGALCEFVAADSNQRKGEFVILVAGKIRAEDELAPETARILQLLLEEMPTKKAAALAARITGEKKNRLYQQALEWRND
ncbi:MAG: 16S rRNA (cytidine(1402)-2'-O)-methyltransferase [Sedimenticola sp.]